MKDRLDYDVFNRKPTYVTLTFGMNDTGYDIYMKDDAKELSEQRIAKSLESYREIEERLLAKNKIKKVLISIYTVRFLRNIGISRKRLGSVPEYRFCSVR